MPLPPALTTCQLTIGPYVDALGAPVLAGRQAVVRPSTVVRDVTTGVVVLPQRVVVVLGADARAVLRLPHTDCAGVDPFGFTYELSWEPALWGDPPAVRFALPQAAGPAAALSLLAPAPSAPGIQVPVGTGPPGPPGPPGPAGSPAVVHRQQAPAATWLVPWGRDRPPVVELWVDGRREFTDVTCPPPYAVATLTFPSPLAGVAVLA